MNYLKSKQSNTRSEASAAELICCARVRVCVCVCMCLCLHLFTLKAVSLSTICLEQFLRQVTDRRCCAEDVIITAKSLHHYFRMKHWATQVALTSHLSCFHTRSGQSHKLTSVNLAFKSLGLHLPLSDITLSPRYVLSRSTSGVIHSREGSWFN